MLNLGSSFVTFLGIALAVAGVGLYFLRSLRPELAKDHDIFFAAISLVCGLILLFQGWRLDPILAFSQYLLAGSAIFFAVENLRLRGVTTAQAKRNTPIVDKTRSVSKQYYAEYDAELEELEPDEELPNRPRIRASQDSRSPRNGGYNDEEPRRRQSNRSSSTESRIGTGERKRQPRRPRPEVPPVEPTDEWGGNGEDRPTRRSSNRPPREDERRQPETAGSRKSRRPPENPNSKPYREEVEETSDQYVDYQPLDTSDEEEDNSRNFDY